MTMQKAIIAGVVAALATSAGAGFQTTMTCSGELQMYYDDGPPEKLILALTLGPAGYVTQVTYADTGERTVDRGDCTGYLLGTCRHIVEQVSPTESLYVDFGLRPAGGNRYYYSEFWSDGYMGVTTLACDAPGGRPPAPGQQGYAPAQRPPAPGQQGYAPAQRPPAPGQQGYAPAQRPPAPGQQGYAPAQGQQGYAAVPSQQGLPPAPPGGLPPAPNAQALPPPPALPPLPSN